MPKLNEDLKVALRVVRFLKENPKKPHDSSEIAKAIKSTKFFVIKIAQDLIRSKILMSVRGAGGGFMATKDKVTAFDIAQSLGYKMADKVDGDNIDDQLSSKIIAAMKSVVIE